MSQLQRRTRQVTKTCATEGIAGLTSRALTGLARRIRPLPLVDSVRDVDVLQADLAHPWEPSVPRLVADEPMSINWVMAPPGPNSGGHTTTFRLIRHLASKGHTSSVYFYDVYGGDLEYYAEVVRTNYADVRVRNVFDGMDDAHAVIATCWESAYPVFNARSRGKRFYLVQDFEPWFFPAGSSALLAENTYRMGFHAITAGAWLAALLNEQYGLATDSFEFGCDTNVYRRTDGARHGVAFYARPSAPRRAFEVGMMSLQLFHERHPDITIHCFGDRVSAAGSAKFPFIDHGLTTPDELNAIYNECFAGLCLSMSNVSLVPHEMLASGCIPVVNDAQHNRVVLDNDFVAYAAPSPHALAAQLSDVVTDPAFEMRSRHAASSVQQASWDDAGACVERILLRELVTRTNHSVVA